VSFLFHYLNSECDLILISGVEIIKKALRVPALTIVKNTGVEPHGIIEKMAAGEGDYGYDALNDKFGNLMAQGICDPTKVIFL
jgi:chaperonin GroEL